jgi:hypothetical protein
MKYGSLSETTVSGGPYHVNKAVLSVYLLFEAKGLQFQNNDCSSPQLL